MGLPAFIDVAISLIFMYLVLSLICTSINEFIATSLKWRAKSLSKACTQLLDDAQLRDAFYNNGLIASTKSASGGGAPPPGQDPAQTPATGGQTVAGGKPTIKEHPSYIDGRSFAMALLDSLTQTSAAGKAQLSQAPFPTIDDIEKIVADLPDSNIRDVLLANIAVGRKDIVTLRDTIAGWFDSTMERLGGDYNRSMKRLSLLVGLGVAVAFNADSVAVGRALWNDAGLRTQAVTAAVERVQQPLDGSVCTQDDPGDKSRCLVGQIKANREALTPFPIGWAWPDRAAVDAFFDSAKADPGHVVPVTLATVLLKAFGLIWTAMALKLGAPFWFDLLAKFVNIRGAGRKPQTAAERA